MPDSSFSFQYVPTRGLTRSTLEFYDIKAKVDTEGKPIEVGFRYPSGQIKVRKWDEKAFRWEPSGETSKAGLFGRDKFAAGSHKFVTITEGEYDSASLYQVLHSPVVSVQSASSALRDCTLERQYLNSFERVYLALDADARGREAARSIANLFDFNKVYHVKFDGLKDANEYLQLGRADDLKNIWWNSKKYVPEAIVWEQEEFLRILQEAPKQGVAYPFRTLTDMTYGIRTGESVLITAQEGVGKTELMHAIEYKLLTETEENVGSIFLEEPKRRHLQALAGLELKAPVHLPDSGCSLDEVSAALRKVVARDGRLNLYSHFGSDDPGLVLDTIRYLVSARGCRFILLDHVSMVVSGLAGEDERKALDYISTRLEMMVKELDFALIFVSHVNDDGKTRGSRYISKVADIRIDLARDVSNADVIERNTTYLTVSKNRYSGKTGPAGRVMFDDSTYSYIELDAANDNLEGLTHGKNRAA